MKFWIRSLLCAIAILVGGFAAFCIVIQALIFLQWLATQGAIGQVMVVVLVAVPLTTLVVEYARSGNYD